MHNIQRYVKSVWPNLIVWKIVTHSVRYFILQLQSKEAMEEVVNGGPYFMNRRPIVVKAWTMDFDFYSKVLNFYPIWIQLHNLPIECWSGDSLSRIGSVVGIPLFIDDCTTRKKKVKYVQEY